MGSSAPLPATLPNLDVRRQREPAPSLWATGERAAQASAPPRSALEIAAPSPATAAALRAHGVEVHFYEASEINKGEGGPTCLTRPILRG